MAIIEKTNETYIIPNEVWFFIYDLDTNTIFEEIQFSGVEQHGCITLSDKLKYVERNSKDECELYIQNNSLIINNDIEE